MPALSSTPPKYYDRSSAELISKPHLDKIRARLEEIDNIVPEFGKRVDEVVN
jgi:hypothetical protein